MTAPSLNNEHIWLLVWPSRREVLRIKSSQLLPRVEIPRDVRRAAFLHEQSQAKFGINSLLVATLCSIETENYVISEVLATDCGPEIEWESIGISECLSEEILRLLAPFRTSRQGIDRFGWIYEALEWTATILGITSSRLQVEKQLNAGNGFAVLKLCDSSENKYWLKAVSHPNQHEFGIATALSSMFPGFLPCTLASRNDWNAWLMKDEGNEIALSDENMHASEAAIRLISLQQQSLGYIDELLIARCSDQRDMKVFLSPLVSSIQEAMDRQDSTRVSPLSHQRVDELFVLVERALELLENAGIPPVLVHGDINPGNILGIGTQWVFIDWSEAKVGNPFCDLQHLLLQVERYSIPMATEVRIACRSAWRTYLEEHQINIGLSLAPITDLVSTMIGRGEWLNKPNSPRRPSDLYLRTLARYLDRAVDSPEFRSALASRYSVPRRFL